MKKVFIKTITTLFILVLCLIMHSVGKQNGAKADGYNAADAINYARTWSITTNDKSKRIRNPEYHDYSADGGDCANFVSQCLYAGGLRMDQTWYSKLSNGEKRGSSAWVGANALRQYLLSLGYSGRDYATNSNTGNLLDYSTVKAGDIVWCYNSTKKTTYGHVMIVSSVSSNGYTICGHTNDRKDLNYTNVKITYHISMNGTIPPTTPPPPPPTDDPVPIPDVVTKDYIVHIDHPSGTYQGNNGVEISGWVVSKIKLNSVMCQSEAIVGGQMNLTSGTTDTSDELNAAGYTDYPYKLRFRGVIPRSGLTANTSYSFSVWMDLATGGQTKVTTSSFRVGALDGNVPTPTPPPGPEVHMLDCIVHIDSPTGSYTDTDVEISGWIVSLRPVASCMAESEAFVLRQVNLTDSIRDASDELNNAGYGQYPYKCRYSGVIPKNGMKSDTDYEFKVWFNFADGSSSGVTSSLFHANEMKNTEIILSSPKGGSNYANNSNIQINGYILSNSPLYYILCQAGDHQYSFDGTDDTSLASSKGYEHAFKFSKTIRCDSLTPNSQQMVEVWTKNADDGLEIHKQVRFTTGSRVYGSLDDYHSVMDSPTNGKNVNKDFEVTGWVAAHAPIAYVIFQAVPTDGSAGGFQLNLDIEPTSELDSGYSGYEYRARYRGIVEFGRLNSNKTYKVTIWAGLADANGGNQRFLAGCDNTFSTGTVTKPVYTNKFNANGGSGAPASIQKTWGQQITLPDVVPTRDGYTFLGWAFKQDAYEAKYYPGAIFTEETDHTLYAVWERAQMIPVETEEWTESVNIAFCGQKRAFQLTPEATTRYRLDAGEGLLTVQNAEGEIISTGTTVELDFTGSEDYYIYAGLASETETGECTITVQRGYPIVFDLDGSESGDEVLYYQYYGESINLPEEDPGKELIVTLNAAGGTITNQRVILNASFQGWGSDEIILDKEDEYEFNYPVTLYAVWEYPCVGSIEMPVRDGFELKGWVTDQMIQIGSDYVVQENQNLNAVWIPKQYQILYDLNGSEGEIEPTNKIHGVDTTLTTVIPERDGFYFIGWSENRNAETADYESGACFTGNTNKTFYAVWTSIRIPVTSFSFAEDDLTVAKGRTLKLIPIIEPVNATDTSVTWTSLNESVATIDEDGTVTAVAEGKAMIKAVCNDSEEIRYLRITVTKAKEIMLPAGLNLIEDEAFMGDSSIEIIRIGNQVTQIGHRAFKNCSNLIEIHIPVTVTTIETDAFDGCPNLVIYCAEGSTAWETALLKRIRWEQE